MSAPQERPSWLKHMDFTAIDLACLSVAFVVAYAIKFGNLGFVSSASWKSLFVMLLLVNLVITLFTNPYSGVFRRRYWEDVGSNLTLALESFIVACVAFYLLKIGEDYSREMLIITYAAYLIMSLSTKFIHKRRLLNRKSMPPADSVWRLVVVTDTRHVEEDAQLVSADDMSANEIVGYCLVDYADGVEVDGSPTAPIDDLARLCAELNADATLVLVNTRMAHSELYEGLMEDGVRVSFGIDVALGVSSEVQTISSVGVLKTIDLARYSFGAGQQLYRPVKRLFDIILGIVGCILTLIVAMFVKVAYVASGDKHPILFKQERVGLRGKRFDLWKFRSMVWDADEVLVELLKDPVLKAQWDAEQKFEDDPRVTKIGRFLRKTSLDEFPQFLNVLKGEMSVVGPRPLVPGELEEHGGRALYNKVKPGITGWWGCNGRSNIEYRERLELEYHYVKNCSLYLDLLCIFRTFVAVLKRDGAV